MTSSKVDYRYLAWDTSTPTGVVAAFEINSGKKKLIAEWTLSLDSSKHSERLLWTIDVILQSAGWKMDSIDGVVVGVGPGSFTGLRIGITCARMLAMQLRIPLIPVSSLAVLARPASLVAGVNPKTLVIGCIDATKGEWFNIFGSAKAVSNCVIQTEGEYEGVWSRGVKERTLPPAEILEEAKAYLKKAGTKANWIAVGQSVERYPDLFKVLPSKNKIEISEPFMNQIQAKYLVQLGFEAIMQGALRKTGQVLPRYLRDSDAEVKLKKGLLKASPGTA